ncbi:MAG: tRNA (adenosine(37)-N6)-dimethylallyltransferase MiaA [Candidatus Saccharimonadales bacterium]
MEIQPLIVIVGPTASGKTSLAIELAEKVGGEIICADSRTVYRGMDIGTAKPTFDDLARIQHWGLDLVNPDQRFTAADFKRYAQDKIKEIRERGHIPFLVGGTGLYVDSVIFDYQFGDAVDEKMRQGLELMSLSELHEYCLKNNIKLPNNVMNKRYVIRAIEQKNVNNKRRDAPLENTYIVGITTERDELRTKIEHRIEQLFADGVVDEARTLGEKYGWKNESMTGNIYPILHKYITGEFTLDEAKYKSTIRDWRLAKRQLTWFKRDTYINWLSHNEALSYLSGILTSEY